MKCLSRFFVLLLCLSCGGCATLIAHTINPDSSGSEIVDREHIKNLGYETHQYCDSQQTCIAYLLAGERLSAESLKLKFDWDLGRNNEILFLAVQRPEEFSPLKGTVVLLHGFNMDASSMFWDATFYRYLGFQVIIPDLLGHGNSPSQYPGFGVHDAPLLAQIIEKHAVEGPVWLHGNSMGAVVALHTVQHYPKTAGLVLNAPMLRFDKAVVNFVERYGPSYARWLSQETIAEGAQLLTAKAGVPIEQTAADELLTKVPIPSLVFASAKDKVSPLDAFESVDNSLVELVQVQRLTHMGMATIDSQQARTLEAFIRQHQQTRLVSAN
ncbi:alpha/beta fold hydrolase [Paraferrimonas sedimenticola]|uniref:Serine aminopeptidase S33 domain-containing protein n=1 Tax=Paraferrimonas sedimenticola TaxID=375674 RepID=A0AA37RVW0_9GAMM|nr:alpha/beta fold hydrolase [Paraferrimonas sedimenticola]GLP95868.1 hypothetical protein GCM10007895_11740 [Paraferrimonas sedimenticola]